MPKQQLELTHHNNNAFSTATVREGIFGLEDGMVSTLGAIVGIAVGTGNQYVVILSGMVVIAVEALSMAAGSYISSKSERDIGERWLKEEAWEIENDPEGEKQELRVWYKERGFSKQEIEILVKRITANKDLWLEEMAHHELKIFPGELEHPIKNALVMGGSYIVGGVVPLVSFFFLSIEQAIVSAIVLSTLGLFCMGALLTRFTYRNWMRSGFEMVVIAMSAALLGFLIAKAARFLFPLVM